MLQGLENLQRGLRRSEQQNHNVAQYPHLALLRHGETRERRPLSTRKQTLAPQRKLRPFNRDYAGLASRK
jgi:hypothetical protein